MLVRQDGVTELRIDDGPVFRETESAVTDEALIDAADWSLWIATWSETDAAGRTDPFYAVSRDGVDYQPRRTSYQIGLGGASRDPLCEPGTVDDSFRAGPDNRMFVVQFRTHALEEYRQAIREAGGKVRRFVLHHAYVVEMDESTRPVVSSLPFVRGVEPFHPAYRIDPEVHQKIVAGEPVADGRYYVELFEPTPANANLLADRISAAGGSVIALLPESTRLQAVLSSEQLAAIIAWNEVARVTRRGNPGLSMDNARMLGGSLHVESIGAFTGAGVRGEVMDNRDPDLNHPAFETIHGSPIPSIPHNAANIVHRNHATAVFGTLFWQSYAPDEAPDAKGMARGGQSLHADWCSLNELDDHVDCTSSDDGAPPADGRITRARHICQLVAPSTTCCDPGDTNCPYKAVFQNNSWGHQDAAGYLDVLDKSLFHFDLLVTQALGNGASFTNREGWSKNVVSVGGLRHENTANKNDDHWGPVGASTGPAPDGRVKPDLFNVYDDVASPVTDCDDAEFRDPCCNLCCETDPPIACHLVGTSFGSPITAGAFSLFFEMWYRGVFTVCDETGCVASGAGAGCTAFDARPQSTTAKAMMINTAYMYSLFAPEPADFTRMNQGWGLPDVGRTYLLRHNMPVIIDESRLLEQDEFFTYGVTVPDDAYALRATLVWDDPPGAARVNDLTLRVGEPTGGSLTCYLGNHGLLDGDWSQPLSTISDCNVYVSPYADSTNTVENVYVQSPRPGSWTVRVRAMEVNEDGHTIYPNGDPSGCVTDPVNCPDPSPMDVDFALVVSLDMDCNQNGSSDADDIRDAEDPAADCNGDGVPDECQAPLDCNAVGACCTANPSCPGVYQCGLETGDDCTLMGGSFAGQGSVCQSNTCNLNPE